MGLYHSLQLQPRWYFFLVFFPRFEKGGGRFRPRELDDEFLFIFAYTGPVKFFEISQCSELLQDLGQVVSPHAGHYDKCMPCCPLEVNRDDCSLIVGWPLGFVRNRFLTNAVLQIFLSLSAVLCV